MKLKVGAGRGMVLMVWGIALAWRTSSEEKSSVHGEHREKNFFKLVILVLKREKLARTFYSAWQ